MNSLWKDFEENRMTNGRLFAVLYIFILLVFVNPARFAVAESNPQLEVILSSIPPLVMKNDRDQQNGVLWDLGKILTNRLSKLPGFTVSENPVVYPWKRAYEALQRSDGKIMLQMARTPERENLFEWIAPVTELSFAFVTCDGSAINSLEDALKLSSVAVYNANRLESYLRAEGFDKSLELTNDSATSARMLSAGRVEAWHASVQEALWLHKKGVIKAHPVIGKGIIQFSVWAVMSKGAPDIVVQNIRKYFLEMQADGTIAHLKSRYGL